MVFWGLYRGAAAQATALFILSCLIKPYSDVARHSQTGVFSGPNFSGISPRMKTKQVIIAAGVGLLLWYLVKQSGRFDIGAASISRVKLEGSGLRLNVKLPLINRSDFSVPVSGFLGRLLFDGLEVGTVTQTAPVTLAPRAMGIVEFTTVISYVGILTSTPLLALLNSISKKILDLSIPGIPDTQVLNAGELTKMLSRLRIQGTVYAGKLGIDINQALTA